MIIQRIENLNGCLSSDFYDRRKSRLLNPPSFQVQRFTKKSVVLCSDFLAANQVCDRLPLTKTK